MTDVLDRVGDHCRATGLTERLKTAFTVFGPNDQRLTPQQLGSLDQFRTRGLAATTEVAKLAGITTEMSVLDVDVLKSGGRFATFDVMLNSGEPHYPVPRGTNGGDELSLNGRCDA